LFLVLLLFSAACAYCQVLVAEDSVTFEANSNLIRIDTSQPGNIWQIGRPSKALFDSAHLSPFAIVTDTINPYPAGNLSSFEFTIHNDGWGLFGSIPFVYFFHRWDTDSLEDGGFIEYSYDGGGTWVTHGTFLDETTDCHLSPPTTIFDSIPAFTGSPYLGNDWQGCFFHWSGWCVKPNLPDSIIVKFTFKSDSIQNNRDALKVCLSAIYFLAERCQF